MPNRIKLMPEALASKIAAGEVVERPASVVKELIENSIDAGATEITVEVTEGGRRLVRVTDNGSGISREDCSMAIERHATSKIAAEEDLFNIKTMGFRGEALSSMAAVARVTLRSRLKGEVSGTRVVVEGFGRPAVTDDGGPEGTSVEVRDLFYNVPARLKFLKSAGVEFGRILDTVKRAAVAFPEIRFKLFHGSSKVMDAKKGGLKERIADVFGEGVLKEVVSVEHAGRPDAIEVIGFAGTPELSHPTSKGLFTYVNKRWVRDRGINRAIIEGYSGMIEGSRYPFAIINIKIRPDDVDVNVHPAKNEVRFKSASMVFDGVKNAVREALSRGAGMTSVAFPKGYFTPRTSGETGRGAYGARESVSPWAFPVKGEMRGMPDLKETEESAPYPSFHGDFLAPGFVGQIWGEFLVFEGEGEFLLIDQHAASERVRFERLKSRYHDGIDSQYLLVPERFDATPEERDALEGVTPHLEKMGFEIVPFGPSGTHGKEAFLIKAVPNILSARGYAGLIKDLIEEFSGIGGSSRVEELVDGALMTIACHSVIRGPRPMTAEEAAALLKDLSAVDFSGRCPHGRPVMKRFTRAEVEAFFKRR
ncbi:MAG: DNA mismatch repair endonuclease MutL [Deltaproteobacteria bacterium]|nr:DNA mismatch repair endonuclease MutL [Deltaproteobacteria bacterium]